MIVFVTNFLQSVGMFLVIQEVEGRDCTFSDVRNTMINHSLGLTGLWDKLVGIKIFRVLLSIKVKIAGSS